MSARRGLRATTATAAASTVMALAACTGLGESTITDTSSPTPTPSESPTSEPMFTLEIPEDICPPTEVIPEEFAAPERIGYTTEFSPRRNGNHPYHECAYYLNDETASLDGIQAVEKIIVEFYVTDDAPLSPRTGLGFSSVDFEKVEAAEYFQGWDQAEDTSEHDLSPQGYGLTESDFVRFQSFASLDNLYVFSYIYFVVTDEDHNMEPDLDTEAAAYQILEAIVAPVVADLERQ